jgi:hypothetical protein
VSFLLCLWCSAFGADYWCSLYQFDSEVLLGRAQQLDHEIVQARTERRDVRALNRNLLEVCTLLRRSEIPPTFTPCMNEGHAAAQAGDWVHALLAYRLAQRLKPGDPSVEARLAAMAHRLQVPARQPLPAEELAACLTGVINLTGAMRLQMSFWILAILLYGMAWMRIGGILSGRLSGGLVGSAVAIAVAVGLVWSLYWADDYRAGQSTQHIAIIRRGEPAYLREGNGLSYPTLIADRLRPGTEVRVLGKRGDWLHLQTASGLIGWTPAAAAEVE